MVPGAHQGVLQHRQLVHVVADVVEQALHQARRDAPDAHADGAGDHRPQLVAGQARDQVLAVADRLGQVAEARAVAEEVGAHGDDHVHRHFCLPRRFEQQLDEGRRFISGAALPGEIGETEKLFELIDEDQQILMRLQPGEAGSLDQAQTAAPQRRLDHALRRGLGKVQMRQRAGFDDGPRQKPDGVVLRPQDRHPPVRPGLGHEATLQRRQQAGPHQRGFAAARGAHHCQEPPAGQAPHQLVALLVAAEKEVRLLLHEGPEARERIGASPVVHRYARNSWATKGRNTSGSNSLPARMVDTSRVRKPSLFTSGSSARYRDAAL